jgi:hypothetical protein
MLSCTIKSLAFVSLIFFKYGGFKFEVQRDWLDG